MSSPDSLISYESFHEDDKSHTVRRHRSSACLGRRNTASNGPTHAHPFAQRASHYPQPRASLITSPSRRDEGVPARYSPDADTEFKYLGSIEQYGWKQGQVPLFLEWYPEKLDRRSSLKFFESGKEYVIGRAPTCDIFFQNSDVDSGISAQHLKIKTLLVPGAVNRIYVWITDGSTNGTYVNGIRVMRGEPVQLCPDDHVTLLKRDNASDSRPNIGFRIIMALEKPKMEDHYTILRNDILGTGTFGAVHKARHLETNKLVAVKIIRSLRGSSISQDLEREIRIMKKLDHPNIVQFHDSFEETKDHDITRYIIMEYVESGTLHDCIQTSEDMSESTVRHIISQILSALEYMHERVRVSHRDLKPANILLVNRGEYPTVKIADLGLAKIEAATKNNTFCGSPGYLAPECTQGPQAPGLNWTMDIYAIGVITYELLTGKRPFGTDLKKDPYSRTLPMLPLQQRKCSAEAIDFMVRLLSPDPTHRPSARQSISHPWFSHDLPRTSVKSYQILPPTEILASPSKTIRATPRLPSPDSSSSDDSFGSSRSSSSSGDSEDEPSTPQGSPKVAPMSLVSDRMDICSIRSSIPPSMRPPPTPVRPASPMNVDTMRPIDKVWCILYPLPGNAAGTTALFLRKTTTTIGSDTRADLILRHPKIANHHCTIVSGTWNKQRGFTGVIHVHDKKPVRFTHKDIIYVLDEANEIVGYTVKFPGVEDDTSMTMALKKMNINTPKIRSSKRKENHFYAPYTPSKRRAASDNTTTTPLPQVDKIVGKRGTSLSSIADQSSAIGLRPISKAEADPVPWGKLVSRTNGSPDVNLTVDSTGLGEVCDFVDIETGERNPQYNCLIFKLRSGVVGIRAIMPIIVDGVCIKNGEKLQLKNNDLISIRNDDMSIVSEYTLQLYTWKQPEPTRP